ncbi:MAG: tRNA lysidine(34) synthetase TilS, partial [Armatimonadetes bacterium]|nr:tRNA lysidine(34) synthetase TilS [Candidatus Hippobium faecium]
MKIIVALSGGPDSVTLLHKLYTEKHTLLAVHFNHNLRETAKRDEIFVSDLCQKLNIPLKIISLNVTDYVLKTKTSTEEGARELRYKYLYEILENTGYDKIALGHNLNDKCETILMNIVRGTGIDGLNGLKAETDHIFRPLINMTKSEIYEYLEKNNLSYCTDETNFENNYTRNKFRNIIIPELLKINSGLFGNLSRLADIAKETEDFMACETEKAMTGFENEITKEKINSLPIAIKHRVIKEIIVRAKGTTKDVSQKEVLRLCDLLEKSDNFKTFLDSGKIYAQMKNGVFSVEEKKEILRPVPFEYKITEPETYIKELGKTLIIHPIGYEKEINSPYLSGLTG